MPLSTRTNNWPLASTTLLAAGAVNIFTMLLALEANYKYALGIAAVSPIVRTTATAIILAAAAWRFLPTRRVHVDPLLVALILYSGWGITYGLFQHGLSYELVRHAFGASTMVVCYWAGLTFGREIFDQRRTFAIVAWATLITALAVMLLCLPQMVSPGYSLSSAPALLALDVALNGGSPWLLLGLLPLAVLGNKRAFLLAVSAMLAVALVRRIRFERTRGAPTRYAAFALATVAIMVGATLFTAGVGRSASSYLPATIFERSERMLGSGEFSLGNPDLVAPDQAQAVSEGEPDKPDAVSGGSIASDQSGQNAERPERTTLTMLDQLSSLRIGQTLAVLESMVGSWTTLITGRGFGSTFTWRYWSDNFNDWQTYRMDQADAMPAYFLLTGGLVFGLIIPLLIVWIFLRILGHILTHKELHPGLLFVLGFGIDMLLSFQPNAHLFWVLLGASRWIYS